MVLMSMRFFFENYSEILYGCPCMKSKNTDSDHGLRNWDGDEEARRRQIKGSVVLVADVDAFWISLFSFSAITAAALRPFWNCLREKHG